VELVVPEVLIELGAHFEDVVSSYKLFAFKQDFAEVMVSFHEVRVGSFDLASVKGLLVLRSFASAG